MSGNTKTGNLADLRLPTILGTGVPCSPHRTDWRFPMAKGDRKGKNRKRNKNKFEEMKRKELEALKDRVPVFWAGRDAKKMSRLGAR